MQSACAVYCHLQPVLLYSIFRNHLINSTIFGKNVLIIDVCFDFLYSFCLKNFLF